MEKTNAERKAWSAAEKEIISMVQPEVPELDYPLRDLVLMNGAVEKVYDIPDDRLMGVLESCWPFSQTVRPDLYKSL